MKTDRKPTRVVTGSQAGKTKSQSKPMRKNRQGAEKLPRSVPTDDRSVFENAPIGFFRSTPRGKFIFVNPALARMYGYDSPQDMIVSVKNIGRQLYADPNQRAEFIRRMAEQGVMESFEAPRLRKNGGTLWTSTSARAVKDEKGKILYYEGFVADITERKQAEDALQESEKYDRALVNALPDLMFRVHRDGVIWDYKAEKISDLYIPPEAFLGKKLTESVPPHVAKPSMDAIEKAIASGELQSFEYQLELKNGMTDFEARIVADETGEVVIVVRDITERKRAEQALRESEEWFRRLADTTSTAIFIYQGEKFVYANQASETLSGYSREELVNLNFWDVVRLEQKDAARQRGFARQQGVGVPDRLEFNFLRKDGLGRWVDFTAGLIDWQGQPAVLGTAFDITERKQAERALREVEERYRTIVEQIPAITYVDVVDGRGTSLYVSPQIDELLGVSVEEWLQGDIAVWEALLHPEDRQRVVAAYVEFGKPSQTFDTEYRVIARDGRLIWFHDHASLLLDEHGQPALIHGVMQDITERKLAEQSLRESEERYRIVAETASDAIITIDEDSTILFANPAVEKVFGYRQEELLGQSLTNIMPDYLRHIHEASIKRYLVTGKKHANWEGLDLPGLHKSGAEIPLEVAFGEFIKDGRHIFTGIIRDVGERRRAEQSLRASEERLAAVMEGSQLGYSDWHIQTGVVQRNERWAGMLGYTLQEIESTYDQWEALIHPDDRARARQAVQDHLDGKTDIHRGEYRLCTKDGSYRWILDQGRIIEYDEQGRPLRMTATHTDITERKQAEERLRVSEERFRALTEATTEGIVFHDQGRILDVNPSLISMFGYENVSEIIGRGLLEFVAPESREHVLKQVQSGNTQLYEAMGLRKDGSTFPVEAIARLYEYQGRAVRVASIRDITARKQAEEALGKSQRRIEAFFHQSLDGFFFCDFEEPIEWKNAADREGTLEYIIANKRFTDVNQAMLDQYGLTREEFLRLTTKDVFAHDLEQGRNLRRRLFDQGHLHIETHERISGGAPVWFEGDYVCLYDSQERITGFFGIQSDITERKRGEEALRQSEEKYRSLFENIPDGIFRTTPDGQILAVNPAFAKMLGFESEQEVRQSTRAQELYAEPSERAYLVQAMTESGETRNVEVLLKRRDGSTRVVLENARAVRGESGEIIYYEGVLTDITERKRRERELEAEAMLAQALGETLELQPLLERLLQAVSHAIPAAEKGSVLLVEAEGRLRIRALSGYADPRLRDLVLDADSGYSARAVRERKSLLIFDIRADSLSYNGEIEEVSAIQSAIVVPLIVQEQVVGSISLDSNRKTAFNDEDLKLLNKFATTAALVIERARLHHETQRRAEETSALLETSLALSSLHLPITLQTIGERAKSLFAADGCRIFLLEPDGATLRCVLALLENPSAFSNLKIKLGEGVTGSVAASGQAEIINDMLRDPRAVQVPGTPEETEAIMFAPLKEGGNTIGVISVRRIGVERPFQPQDLELLKALASMAASSVSNARLFDETQQHLRELETLQSVSATLRQAHTIQEMLPVFVAHAARAVNAQAGSIYLLDESSGDWVSQGWIDAEGKWIAGTGTLRHSHGEGVTGRVGERGEPYITADWRIDPVTVVPSGEEGMLVGLSSGIALPLRAEERVIGIMHIWYGETHIFTEDEKRLLTAISDMAGNAIQRAGLHEETLRSMNQLQALQMIDRAITTSLDLQFSLHVLLEQTLVQLHADAAGILLYHMHTRMLEYAAGRGFRGRAYERSRLRLGEGYAGYAALERQIVQIVDLKETDEKFARAGSLAGEEFAAYFVAPLIAKGQIVGLLEIFQRVPFHPDAEWLKFFQALAQQAAIAIDNAQLFNNLQRSNTELILAYDKTIEGWSKALDLRDKETEGHTLRVTEMTMRLAAAMGFADEELVHIRRGALLHDIGKMGVQDQILFKKESLTDEEWVRMRQHPQFAYEMLSPIEFLRPALDIPYCHHEKWDGSGYPRGLKGEQIPLAARLFAVIDVWDALCSGRPYRPAWTKHKALNYIQSLSGSHFDPNVVVAFLKIFAATGEL